jgi:hypothetical protein
MVSTNRLSLGDSFETGESLTVGIDFEKKRINQLAEISKTNK